MNVDFENQKNETCVYSDTDSTMPDTAWEMDIQSEKSLSGEARSGFIIKVISNYSQTNSLQNPNASPY
jgi:hypothetical protein